MDLIQLNTDNQHFRIVPFNAFSIIKRQHYRSIGCVMRKGIVYLHQNYFNAIVWYFFTRFLTGYHVANIPIHNTVKKT